MTKRLVVYVGARPNAPKAWTLLSALRHYNNHPSGEPLAWDFVHTGQHYDSRLGEGFCRDLGVDITENLGVGAHRSDGEQLGALIAAVESDLLRRRPSAVVVVGDVNTTLAAAIVSSRNGFPVVHVEAGLRSAARTPEEVNRRIITRCATHHLAPSAGARRNLQQEGVDPRTIYVVGNLLTECFLRHAEARRPNRILDVLGLANREFVLLTLHKSAILADRAAIAEVVAALSESGWRVVFPCHPHTELAITTLPTGLASRLRSWAVAPQGYHEFGKLLENSRFVVTDSDGVQEECTVAGVPCITVAESTARPETVTSGTNTLVRADRNEIRYALRHRPGSGPWPRPDMWDDMVSVRVAKALSKIVPQLPGTGGRTIRTTPAASTVYTGTG